MTTIDGGTVVVGSGVAGALVARELVAQGEQCTIVERGAWVPWREQVERRSWEADAEASRHNHVVDEEGIDYPWTYVYAVGGSCNRWAGTSPRFLPEDFRMRSEHGIMRDWPLDYAELAPYYRLAERAMGVAGEANELMPDTDYAMPAHPLSAQDVAVRPHLQPFVALPQARPTQPVGGRAACCGSARCQLCPVDARFSVLNSLPDVLTSPHVRLLRSTVAARLTTDRSGRKIEALECVVADGRRLTVRGERFVVAANGIESAALLLRSDIVTEATGRYLFDHRNAKLLVRTRRDVGPGHGSSLVTGASYRYYAGDFRRHRAGVMLVPFNPGAPTVANGLVDGIVAGRTGASLRRAVIDEWRRTVALDVYADDVPDRRCGVTLASEKDAFGLPRNKVRYEPPTPYLERAVAHLLDDVPRRLAPLGARQAEYIPAPQGAHLLGTLRMGPLGEGVVDRDQRHHLRENLFVSGGAVFPTYSPAHPTLTISALSIRLGRLLAGGPS